MSSWFDRIPAYRLATFRVAVAVSTIGFHVPLFDRLIRTHLNSSFHFPMYPWVPALPWAGGIALILSSHLAAWCLLFGIFPRLSAGFLAASGVYVVLLDPQYFSHNTHLHLILLALLACSDDRLPLLRLLREDDGRATCSAWPERLIQIQVSIVYFYTALDKVFSPFWGITGTLLADLPLASHGPGFSSLQRVNQAVVRAFPGVMSVATIITEFFLALAFMFRPLWQTAIPVGLGFAVYLEFSLKPNLFPWDLLAALIVFLPAGDRAYTILYDAECPFCQWNRRVISQLDWLRRLRWVPPRQAALILTDLNVTAARAREAMHLVGPTGRVYRGYEALRMLLVLLPGPLYVVFAVARFDGFGTRFLGLFSSDDLVFLMAVGLLLLWAPGASWLAGQPLYARVASARYRILTRVFGVNCEQQTCSLHGLRAGRMGSPS